MKRFSLILIAGVLIGVGVASGARAQMMPLQNTPVADDGHTAREEAEGKELFEKLGGKEVTCDSLTDENFEALGEYFMGRMAGEGHAAMNAHMEAVMGKEGEEAMHEILGKRMSGCVPDAEYPAKYGIFGMAPMMGGMGRGSFSYWNESGSAPFGITGMMNPMMNFGGGFGALGLAFMLFWWILVIVAIAALLKWIFGQFAGKEGQNRAIDILKERYARGEISKEEFEAKKKEIL